tara:strand:+ start:4526 stop:6172 length:1647 start_codon:yes stop_codon:yes gene_type:complete
MSETIPIFTDKLIPVTDLVEGENARYSLGVDKALINSVRTVGIINPLTVKPNGKGYIVVAGHRRLSAAQKLNLKEVPCRVVDWEQESSGIIALIENSARKNLSDLEYAEAFSNCPESSDSQIAKLFGKTVTFVKQRRALANLLPSVKKMIEKHDLDYVIAAALTKLSLNQQQELIASKEINWKYSSNIFHFVDDLTKLTTVNALFDLNDYDGTLISDLWAPKSVEVFGDQEQAATLQKVAVTYWVEKIASQKGWSFCHIITNQNEASYLDQWNTSKYILASYQKYHHPSEVINLWKNKLGKEYSASHPDAEFGVLVNIDRLDSISWMPFVTLKVKPANGAVPQNSDEVIKEFKWGPTGNMVFAAHRTDLVREALLADKNDSVLHAAIICTLSSIRLGREPLTWEKVEDRKELALEPSKYMEDSNFIALMKKPSKELKQMAKEYLINAVFDEGAYFGGVDVLAKYYRLKLGKDLFPTEQIFRLMPLHVIQSFREKNKMKAMSFKTKKEAVKATAESCKQLGITWCPEEQEFTKKQGTIAQELDDEIPVE